MKTIYKFPPVISGGFFIALFAGFLSVERVVYMAGAVRPSARLPSRLSLDIETFSSVDLSRSGVYRYAEAPDFTVLLVGYSFDFGPVRCVDLAGGEVLPDELLSALLSPSVEKWAFNASFERVCLSRYLRDMGYLFSGSSSSPSFLSPASWRCTMVWSAYLGLPMSLAGVGAVLGLEKQKLTTGRELIRYFCSPARPSLLNGQGNRNLPSTDPERWGKFVEYNIRDVETEMEICSRLSGYPVPDFVWEEYAMDQEINDRGILVDCAFVSSALSVDAASREELSGQLSELTDISNPNSVAEIRSWLSRHGMDAAALSKGEVREMLLCGDVSPAVREVLLLRQQLAKTSVRKYQAMENCVCADGRIRGAFQFYGASRSGRWAGRLVQLQNLPQNHIPELSSVRDVVRKGDYGSLRTLYDSVPDVLSELIRTAFVPSPGKKFIVCDFSAIEARVLAWLAGETWRQEVFASGGDIYCASASAMFHVPVEKHGVNGHLRQKGKIAELALGYGGGAGALRAMGALEMGVPEEELQPLVDMWRGANPNICRLWWNVDKTVKTVIRQKTAVSLFSLRFACRSGMLFITLPSGRSLSYVHPALAENRFGGESVCYMGTGTTRKWEKIESYGPKFVENIVQGISRDLLCFAMSALRQLPGVSAVAHVHDEVILEADPDVTVEEVSARMAACPPWAAGLVLQADGYECEFYRKD